MACSDPKSVVNVPLELQCALEHTGSTAGFFSATPVSRPSALTTAATGTADLLYGAVERDLINNSATRLAELESKLKTLGLLS